MDRRLSRSAASKRLVNAWLREEHADRASANRFSLIEPIAVGVDKPKRVLTAAAIRSHWSMGPMSPRRKRGVVSLRQRSFNASHARPFDNLDGFYKSIRNHEAGQTRHVSSFRFFRTTGTACVGSNWRCTRWSWERQSIQKRSLKSAPCDLAASPRPRP